MFCLDNNFVTIVEEGGVCFSSATSKLLPDLPSAYTVAYANVQTLESAYFRYHLRASQTLCKENQNFTACQILGNLCVMFMYNEDNYQNSRLSSTDACKEYLLVTSAYRGDFVNRLTDWPAVMPWLFYKVDTPVEVLDKTAIGTKFKRGQKMQFVLVKFAGNGTFLGIVNDTTDIQLCVMAESILSKAFSFTTTFKSQCKLKLRDLWKNRETIFMIYIYG